jgi:hypothetical protein
MAHTKQRKKWRSNEMHDYKIDYPNKLKRFENISEPDEYETARMVKRFSGKLTKSRYKLLSRYCRQHSWRSNCSHEWDCCGCVFRVSMAFTYRHNQVSVFLTESRNY